MYTEENKGFTIITNFGCDQHCKYCISRFHPILKGSVTDVKEIDYDKLEKLISESSAPTVNLSGGGDPFYQWNHHLDFYYKVHDIATKYGKKLDVHTRILPSSERVLSLFRKVGLSIEYWDKGSIRYLAERFDKISEVTSIRVIQVLDSKMTEQDCREYIDKMKSIGVKQITFRQMFGNKKAYEHFTELKDLDWGEGVMFLPDGEYHNYFFTTNNEYHPYFFGDSEEDRMTWKKRYEDIEQSCN